MCKPINHRVSKNLCLLVVLAAFSAFAAGCSEEAPRQQEFTPQVGIVELSTQNVPSVVELGGRVASHATAEVRPQVSGIILRRMFEEGSNVIAGQQLYQIDPALYQAQYDTAVASQLKAQTAMDNAKKIMDRYTEVIKVKGVSQQEYDTATSAYNQSKAELAAAQAAVQTAKINLDYTKVYSPVSGRTGISSVTEGALVTAGQPTPLVYVQQMDPMYIDITQSSSEFLRLQRALKDGTMSSSGARDDSGKEVDVLKVRLVLEDGHPYVKYEDGRLLRDRDGNPVEHEATMMLYDATVDQSTGSITLRAVVDNPDHLLLPGMFVRAKVTEGIVENAILAPLAAVERTARGEAQVKIINAEGKVEERIIESNRIYNNRAWIVLPGVSGARGLDVGEKLIVEGLNRVRAGMPANTYPAGSKPAPQRPIPTAPQQDN
jgi:membrane fusion protein (multidrug efflux system)